MYHYRVTLTKRVDVLKDTEMVHNRETESSQVD